MNFYNRAEEDIKLEVNIVSLIDVVLLLVIFFMITTSFVAQPGINVKLPQASAKEVQKEKELTVIITRDKKVYLNDDLLSLSLLAERLGQALKQGSKAVLIVKADELVPHGLVVKVMDVAKKVGIETLAIATRQEE